MKQYHLGKWVGAYYTELTNSLGIVGMGSSLVNLTVLWAVASDKILSLFPWLTYPLFMGIVFFVVLVILPILDYTLLYKTRQAFQNRQGYAHDNPFKKDIEDVKTEIRKLRKDISEGKV